MVALDLDHLHQVNTERCLRWHGPETEPWTLADWSNAMCGEAGEAANVVKKIRRIDTGTDRDEGRFLSPPDGIDLSQAIVDKFNAVSIREGFPERLERLSPSGDQ